MLSSRSKTSDVRPRRRVTTRRTPGRRILFATLYLVWLGLLSFGGIKLFWWARYGQVSQREPSQEIVWRHYYGEVFEDEIVNAAPSLNDDRIDILLLGGSVMEQTWPYFQKYFAAHGIDGEVYNVARAAHNSRDSALKYTQIADKPFDYVLVYNGINDVPMNYIPDADFSLEYKHCGWFNALDRRLEVGRINLQDAIGDTVKRYAVRSRPDEDLLPFGAVIKTPPAIARNLGQIVDLARRTGSTPVLMTFGHYIEPGYNRKAYLNGDYHYGKGPFGMPVEDWGLPEHVPAIMAAQNDAIRRLAAEKNVLLIEQARLITGRGNYCDVCHLSYAGCELFVQNVMDALREANAMPDAKTDFEAAAPDNDRDETNAKPLSDAAPHAQD
ncbi:hypothetical protein GC176_27140 [bacterium]|nr:hypothetical protein [bacterium]